MLSVLSSRRVIFNSRVIVKCSGELVMEFGNWHPALTGRRGCWDGNGNNLQERAGWWPDCLFWWHSPSLLSQSFCHHWFAVICLSQSSPLLLLSIVTVWSWSASLFLPSYVENVAQTSLSGFINFKPHQTLQGNQNSLQTLFLKR